MDDYIKRSDAINAIKQRRKGYEEKAFTNIGNGFVENRLFSDASLGCQAAEEEIKFLPAADVVEVVRCKDCVHRSKFNENYDICGRNVFYSRAVHPNYYCSEGERNCGAKMEVDGDV